MKLDLFADIDSRATHIEKSVEMGCDRADITNAQHKEILQVWSKHRGVTLDTVNELMTHINNKNVWSKAQTILFAEALRICVSKPAAGKRGMQTHKYLEFYFTGGDWERLTGQETPSVTLCEDLVAARMHDLGMVCCDAQTLKRASAIVEHCSQVPAGDEQKIQLSRAIKSKLKNLDKSKPWPFDYREQYPRSPLELPQYVLDHACGTDVQPVQPPPFFLTSEFALIVQATPYKRRALRKSGHVLPTQPAESAQLQPAGALPMFGPGPFAHLFRPGSGPGHPNHPWWSTMDFSGMAGFDKGDIPI